MFPFRQSESPEMNWDTQIANRKTAQSTPKKFHIKVGIILGLAKTKQFIFMEVYLKT
jgi:hypothetical protein